MSCHQLTLLVHVLLVDSISLPYWISLLFCSFGATEELPSVFLFAVVSKYNLLCCFPWFHVETVELFEAVVKCFISCAVVYKEYSCSGLEELSTVFMFLLLTGSCLC